MNLLEMSEQIFIRRAAREFVNFGPWPLSGAEAEVESRAAERAEDVHIAKRSIQLAEAFRDAWVERVDGKSP